MPRFFNFAYARTSSLTVGFLAALLGVSVGLNFFFALKIYSPQFWQSIELAMIRPPDLRPDDHVRGPADARVTVIEYSDFQCPYCAEIHPSLVKLAEQGKIKWAFRHYPLSSIHPRATEAAEAAECAGDQGRFWEYADALFAAQKDLQAEESVGTLLIGLATRAGLNEGRFQTCLVSARVKGIIRAEVMEGNAKRIEATPTMFVNGKRHVGALSLKQLEQLVEPR